MWCMSRRCPAPIKANRYLKSARLCGDSLRTVNSEVQNLFLQQVCTYLPLNIPLIYGMAPPGIVSDFSTSHHTRSDYIQDLTGQIKLIKSGVHVLYDPIGTGAFTNVFRAEWKKKGNTSLVRLFLLSTQHMLTPTNQGNGSSQDMAFIFERESRGCQRPEPCKYHKYIIWYQISLIHYSSAAPAGV